MKTTEHGIENSRGVENIHHMRLMALLQELVREKGYKGAARVLEIDPQTVTDSAKTGRLTRRVRDSLERALQEGVGSAAERQRKRNEELEGRVEGLAGEVKGVAGEVETLGQGGAQASVSHRGRGPGHAGAGPQPSMRREYPDLATREPAPDDEEVFGEAWPLIVEWRGLKDAHPNEGRGLDWLTAQERVLELELALLEEHGMTLPPEKQPLRGLDRSGQTSWRRTALYDTRRARRKAELLRKVRRVVTLGLSGGGNRRGSASCCRTNYVNFCGTKCELNRMIWAVGRRKSSHRVPSAVIMDALLGFFQGFQP